MLPEPSVEDMKSFSRLGVGYYPGGLPEYLGGSLHLIHLYSKLRASSSMVNCQNVPLAAAAPLRSSADNGRQPKHCLCSMQVQSKITYHIRCCKLHKSSIRARMSNIRRGYTSRKS